MKKIKITESQLRNLIINEQLLKGIGDKIKSGINNVAQKVVSVTQKQPGQAATNPEQKGRTLEQLRPEWLKINTDTSNMNGFGESIGQTESAVSMQASFQARVAILKKMNKQQASFGTEIVDEALFELPNGNYHKLIILKPVDNR